jgi:hypothetical protein
LLTLAGVPRSVATLQPVRSAWGKAVHDLAGCRAADEVYDGHVEGRKDQRPGYALADLGWDDRDRRLVRWTLIGEAAVTCDRELCAAWMRAGHGGVGRDRVAFAVESALAIGPSGEPEPGREGPWRLSEARWPLKGDPAETPCRLEFPAGLHLRIKKAGWRSADVLTRLEWSHLIDAASRRVQAWLPPDAAAHVEPLKQRWLDSARERRFNSAAMLPGGTDGWSRRQENRTGQGHKHYLDLAGHIDLPEGPGAGWPFLLACHWLGLGHHTTEGMGWFRILPLQT